MNYINDEALNKVAGGSVITITVAPGDTLGALAKKFSCSIDDICRWNDIENPDLIYVGQKLKFKF